MSHLLILCPLPSEMKFLVSSLVRRAWHFEVRETSKISLRHSAERSVTLGVGGHGKTQFGVQTQYLLGLLPEVSAVICLGAGGGLAEEMRIGDLVISEKIIEHDYLERFDPRQRVPEYLGHSGLLAQAKKAHRGLNQLDFDVHFGSIASGDEDIIEPERARELFDKTKALAVAWEGVGGARACAFNSVPYLEVRAITDNARSEVRESFVKNLQICMDNAALFIQELLDCRG